MRILKKVGTALAALSPAALFAEGVQDVTLDSAVTQLQTAAQNAITSVKPAVIAILVALFFFVGVGLVWKLIRRNVSKG